MTRTSRLDDERPWIQPNSPACAGAAGGLLENDLILERFMEARGPRISDDELTGLDRLLRLSDNELWDLLGGRAEPDVAALRPLVAALRAA